MRVYKSIHFFPVGLIGNIWHIILSNYLVKYDALLTKYHVQGALRLNQPSPPFVRGFQLNLEIGGKEGLPFILLIKLTLLKFVGLLNRKSELQLN